MALQYGINIKLDCQNTEPKQSLSKNSFHRIVVRIQKNDVKYLKEWTIMSVCLIPMLMHKSISNYSPLPDI